MISPLTAEDFAALMGQLGLRNPAGRFAVACSGGADSMALALLAREWGQAAKSGPVVALIFDHGLRPSSGSEAAQVASWLQARGIMQHILVAEDLKPGSDLQARAREARYRALEGWCRAAGVDHLLLGHHLDDQAETFLMRLARGSGVDGLSAMATVSPPPSGEETPLLVRPFIHIPKERLRATLEAIGQQWIEDPSNEDPGFLRTRVRNFLGGTNIEGLNRDRLAATAGHMARARHALEFYAHRELRKCLTFDQAGFGILNVGTLLATPEDIQLRILSRIIRVLGGAKYPPRLAGVEGLRDQIVNGDLKGATLGGVLFERSFEPTINGILVCREAAAIADYRALEPGGSVLWDGRYHIHASRKAPTVKLGALGERGWLQLAKEHPGITSTSCPYAARLALPALMEQGKFVAVPNLGYSDLENSLWHFESALPAGFTLEDRPDRMENSKRQ